jgi:transaldolase
LDSSIWNVCPDDLPVISDPAVRLVKLAMAGYAQLGSDTLLKREFHDRLSEIIDNVVRQLDRNFSNDSGLVDRGRSEEVLLETALNFLGMERKRAGFSDQETGLALEKITQTLQRWERAYGNQSLRLVIERMLTAMKMVLSGKGMVAKMAEEIESNLAINDLAGSFIATSRKVLQGNVYYKIVDDGLSKFGNDSATGLRWARHLGAVQVSSNPVIAARAYEEIAELWNRFASVAAANPQWSRDSEKYADEIALYGTVNSLLPNILDFRPIALLSDFKDGMVSIQLNPRKAMDIEGSTRDALLFYSTLKEILQIYDRQLTGSDRTGERARPNIVFKVSTSGEEAVRLTESLDEKGIGTNNTVTFTVSQEVELTLTAMKGLASALKAGIPITTIYITNMEGRLEDHLREAQAEDLLLAVPKVRAAISSIAQKIQAAEDIKKADGSFEKQVNILCSKKFLKSLVDGWFLEAVGEDKKAQLEQTENDIRMSGIYVTRRVFQLLFRAEVKSKIVQYIAKEFDLPEKDAKLLVGAVDLLPASKRRAEDTYLVLADRRVSNLTNTEFPDHQLKVLQKSRETNFNLSDFENSIAEEPDKEILERLLKIPDFRKAYLLTPNLVAELSDAGIEVESETGGMEPGEWSDYGPVRKTMDEFNNAYSSFRSKLINSIAKPAIIQEKTLDARAE